MSGERPVPRVSVLMAVHDGEDFLREAVESILAQTLSAIELVVVDDASTDGSSAILSAFDDPRLVLLRNEKNLGLPASLNRALAAARAPLIGRLDADDSAEPHRFERQVETLGRRPELDVLGSWTIEIDEHGREIGRFSFPADEALILWAMSRTNVVYHPTVVMRRRTLETIGSYRRDVECADDYDLFTRILMSGGRIDILPERLVRYRRTAGQTSLLRFDRQQAEAREVRRRYVRWLSGVDAPGPVVEAAAVLQAHFGDPPPSPVVGSAVALQRAILRGVLARSSREGRRRVAEHAREALLHHSGRLREQGRTAEAATVWSAALRTPGGWRESRVLVEGAAIARDRIAGRAPRDTAPGE